MRDERMHPADDSADEPDAELSRLLRQLSAEPPVDEVDWSALRASIHERAELPLARLRTPAQRRATWSARRLVPIAAAASVTLAVWLGIQPGEPAGLPVANAFPTAEEALQADVTEQEFRRLVSGQANADALLLIALDDG